jgi:hypothetical protein
MHDPKDEATWAAYALLMGKALACCREAMDESGTIVKPELDAAGIFLADAASHVRGGRSTQTAFEVVIHSVLQGEAN